MKIPLNLATSPLESNRRFVIGSAVVGTIGIAAMLVLSWRAYSLWHADTAFRAEQSRLERRMEELQQRRHDLELFFNRPETVRERDRAAFLNGLIQQRSFPWTKIFMDLERTLPEGVRVIKIEPRMAEGRVEVKLSVGAMTDEGKLKFLRALEQSPAFSHVELLSETRSARPGEADRVVLDLRAWYETS